jgi:hypothetical protein
MALRAFLIMTAGALLLVAAGCRRPRPEEALSALIPSMCRHDLKGFHATLKVEPHAGGAIAQVDLCNKTEAPLRLWKRMLPNRDPLDRGDTLWQPVFHLEAAQGPRPRYCGSFKEGSADPRLDPIVEPGGMRTFRLELAQVFVMSPGATYTLQYDAPHGDGQRAVSNLVTFRLP